MRSRKIRRRWSRGLGDIVWVERSLKSRRESGVDSRLVTEGWLAEVGECNRQLVELGIPYWRYMGGYLGMDENDILFKWCFSRHEAGWVVERGYAVEVTMIVKCMQY
jgi:hypothetical protein